MPTAKMSVNPFPSVKEVTEFTWEVFSFVDSAKFISLSSGEMSVTIPKHGRYAAELKRIFSNATDVIGDGLLKNPTPFPTGASLWDTTVLKELSNGARVPTRNEDNLKGADAETLAAADALIAYKIYRLALKALKPEILRRYQTLTMPAAQAELAAKSAVAPDENAVPITRAFAHSFRQIVAVQSGDKDRYVKLSDANYDEYAAAADELQIDRYTAKQIVDGADMAMTAAQIGKGKKIADALDKYKTSHPALTSWQGRHAEEALQTQADLKAKILITVSKVGTDYSPVRAAWAGDTLVVNAAGDISELVKGTVELTMDAALVKDHKLTVK